MDDGLKTPRTNFKRYASLDRLDKKEQLPIIIDIPSENRIMEIMSNTKRLYDIMGNNIVCCSVNGQLKNMNHPLDEDCQIVGYTLNDEEGRITLWNTTSVLLNAAVKKIFGKVSFSAVDFKGNGGFYCDVLIDRSIPEEHFSLLVNTMYELRSSEYEVIRAPRDWGCKILETSWEMKSRLKKEYGVTDHVNVFKLGDHVGACFNDFPLLLDLNCIKCVKITGCSAVHYENRMIQRIYGISFASLKEKDDYELAQEEAAKRDHRVIGTNQELFFFSPLSPGSCFFLPHGTIIYDRLVQFIKNQYEERGYQNVISPNICNSELWKISGHWDHYKDNMFVLSDGDTALKGMNCPNHCIMFKSRTRSYRELPIRLAEFGVLHRNEPHGALTGLTRVRKFVQDDAHIFVPFDNVGDEIMDALKFLEDVYSRFDLEYSLELSTRPDKHIGTEEDWDEAENMMRWALDTSGHEWVVNKGDGAFYGPKIDIHIKDSLNRSHQCGTIQLDFNLPERFELEFQNKRGELERPVLIHRAIYGSVERFFALLCEHYGGKWPFWLSPRQIMIIPVNDKLAGDVLKIKNEYYSEYCTDTDVSTDMMAAKIAKAQIQQYNYILVVGTKELTNGTVNVRQRDGKVLGEMTHNDFKNLIKN